MQRVFVYGGAGFLGRHLIERLASAGIASVLAVDKKPLAEELFAPLDAAGVSWRAVQASSFLDPALDDVVADTIFCTAGATSVDAALDAPAPVHRENVEIAVGFSEWLRRRPTSFGVYVSSDEVLGESTVPLDVDARLAPTQPYAASKAAAEIIVNNYCDVYGIPVAMARACNMVGSYQQCPKLLPTTVHALLDGKPVPIHGDGSQTREWMAVQDFCDALVLLGTRRLSGTFQATTGFSMAVKEVVPLVATALRVPVRTVQVPDRRVQDRAYAMDPRTLCDLGWRPKVDGRTALARAARALAGTKPGGGAGREMGERAT